MSLESIFRKVAEPASLDARVECGKIGDLAKLGKRVNIVDPYSGSVVRKIEVLNKSVRIEAAGISMDIPSDQAVFFQPCFLDRGSYLVWVAAVGQYAKIACEFDGVEVV